MTRQTRRQDHDLSTSHLVVLQNSGEPDKSLYGLGDLVVGVDHQVVLGVLKECSSLSSPQRPGLDADDGLDDTSLAGHKGTEDVHLVVLGHRNEEVRLPYPGLIQNVGIGTTPTEDLDVQNALYLTAAIIIDLDDRDVVFLVAETVSYIGADLAGTHHDDAHGLIIAHQKGQRVACPLLMLEVN